MPGQGDPLHLVLVAFEGFVAAVVFAVQLVALASNRAAVARGWRRGLALGAVLAVLAVPQCVSTAFFLDPGAMLEDLGQGGALPESVVLFGVGFGLLVGLAGSLLQAGWLGLMACVAEGEWGRLLPGRPLYLGSSPRRGPRLAACAGFGLGVGIASAALFFALGVDLGQGLAELAAYFPGLASASPLARGLIAMPLLCAAAIGEEVGFRGALLGFLWRVGGDRRWARVGAVVVVTGTWALLHLSVTDAPGLKVGQIALVGLALCWIARREGLGAAIAAHLALNLGGLAGALAMGAV